MISKIKEYFYNRNLYKQMLFIHKFCSINAGNPTCNCPYSESTTIITRGLLGLKNFEVVGFCRLPIDGCRRELLIRTPTHTWHEKEKEIIPNICLKMRIW